MNFPPASVPRNLFKKGTTWVSSTTPKLRPCCQPTFRFLEEFPETAKTWCDGSGWDGFGPLLLSELLLRATNGPGCWLSTGMNKRLLPCVFVGVEQAFDDLEFDSCHFKWDSEIPRIKLMKGRASWCLLLANPISRSFVSPKPSSETIWHKIKDAGPPGYNQTGYWTFAKTINSSMLGRAYTEHTYI